MDLAQVDPFDEPGIAVWLGTAHAAEVLGREGIATPWRLPEIVAAVQSGQRDRVKTMFSGVEDGRVVVAGHYEASMIDSLDHARLFVGTHPDHRRRGFGSAMLGHLEEHAREQGRTVLNAEGAWPHEAPADGRGTEPAEFLVRHGFRFGLGDVHRVLPLPVDPALLDRLAAEAAPRHTAYSLRSWVGAVPDELVQGFAELTALLMVEAPTGELEREPDSADVDALRRGEQLLRDQGRTVFNTVALDGDGAVVAYTNLGISAHDPDNAFQWGTLVRRADRGHRLGMAVKVANLRLLQEGEVRAVRVHTWNAGVNDHMIDINERLGFRAVERTGEFQKKLV